MTAANGRPGRVTFIAVLVWLQAFFDLLGGIALLVLQNDAELRAQLGGSTGVIVTGIVLIALALIIFAIARGLLRGSRTARAIVTVVQLLSIASVIYAAAVFPAQLPSAAISAAISLIVIIMLWSGRAGDFFRS
ncbi:hypothetical protein [Leifsonia poae]|uniref:Uncharacterized protein n=1 Tax=Leifsonia poae TaxID=110933 RepID=A0A9W6HDB3_9MICO|nr:hypothetical protein [Leifsonia poae]GLJ78018.1 hypothetical protein GCM10017584_35920 [Leifsonia poae]